jgi:cytoskeletal protein CcmA (bactofilin family)
MNVVIINGKRYEGGRSISVNGDSVYIDGKKVDSKPNEDGILEVRIEGGAISVVSDASVTVNGDVHGDVKAGHSVHCKNVEGSVRAGHSVNCGNVGGDVDAGHSVMHH